MACGSTNHFAHNWSLTVKSMLTNHFDIEMDPYMLGTSIDQFVIPYSLGHVKFPLSLIVGHIGRSTLLIMVLYSN